MRPGVGTTCGPPTARSAKGVASCVAPAGAEKVRAGGVGLSTELEALLLPAQSWKALLRFWQQSLRT